MTSNNSVSTELDRIYQEIAAIGRSLGAKRVVLFGSRARGDFCERSDIDIAVYGANPMSWSLFIDELEKLPTLLNFDLVYVDDSTSTELVRNIEKDGVILMDKLTEKGNKYARALNRLSEALEDYQKLQLDIIRDGIIQRFEFCTELAWKTTREYLIDQGYADGIDSPKSVMRKAYSCGLINNETGWIELLNARNPTSHIYDEETANRVLQMIQTDFLPIFRQLADALNLK